MAGGEPELTPAEFIVDQLESGDLKPFKAKPLDTENNPLWVLGMPTHDAHKCPGCGRWEMFDVHSGLCRSCHGALRLARALGPGRT